jgi:hypothetical protein
MKLITALYTAAFVLAPAVGFAMDSSSSSSASGDRTRQQDMAGDKSYPYPDWPAIKKTEEPLRQNGADQQKAAEKPSLLEKAGRALETLTGSSATTKEGSSQEGK